MRLRFSPQKDGLVKVLSPLETEIMRLLWQDKRSTVKKVHRRISQQREIAYTTVMTTMSRLSEKGLLNRQREGLAYVYTPAISEEELVATVVRQVIDSLFENYKDMTLEYLFDRFSRSDKEALHYLQNIVHRLEESSTESQFNMRLRFSPQKDGLVKVLGPLQTEIMRLLWQDKRSTVKKVHRRISQQREIAYTTVMTTMSRLSEKGLLNRQREGLAYVYTPAISEEELVATFVRQVIDGVMEDYRDLVLSYLADYFSCLNNDELHGLREALRQHIATLSDL